MNSNKRPGGPDGEGEPAKKGRDTGPTQDKEPPDNMEDVEEGTVTMLDVLEEEQSLEADAEAVLGGSDDQNCTYNQGYLPRQALYACTTCMPPSPGQSPAGICLACSYHCHEGHKLVELYTKRSFRCDCGNSRFPNGAKCNLEPNKAAENEKNSYNQNFRGVYCTCARPYPDPEDDTPDEMLQCIVCEDWYHGRHLGCRVPPEDDYEEMVCADCMLRYPFLWGYSGITEASPAESNGCLLKKDVEEKKGATFWPQGWRRRLCGCKSCVAMYEEKGVKFLTDEGDTVQAYEASGKERPAAQGGSHYERGMQALSNLDRVQQVEAIHGYNDLREQLKSYLKSFADERKVVREEDIRNFFSDLEARKRDRAPISIPFFCR